MTSETLQRPTLRACGLVPLVAVLLLAATLGGLPGTSLPTASAQSEQPTVLFFHRTTGFRHDSIEDAIAAVEELGAEHGFSVTATQDAAVFEDAGLREYAAVVFYTDGENTLSHAQRTAFERYMHRGGGFVGLHSTSNMDKTDWPWWEDLLGGALFSNHPPIQAATMHVEDPTHPATAHLPAQWAWTDEWYNFTADPRERDVHVLLSVDESTYSGGQHGAGHPVAWCSSYDGGRAFYTAIGHSGFHYDDPLFRGHILGAIRWAAGLADGDCGEQRAGPPTEAAFEKVALDDNTANPMKLDIAPDGRVFYTELGGTLKIWHPDTQAITVAGRLDVYRDQENGLLGIALDPNFEQNNWVYLYYSDPATVPVDGTVGGMQHLSRFTLDPVGETLIRDSEVVLLKVPHQRQECCHSSGHLEFDSVGNLYLSTGDDTNPFGSSGFGPFDYGAGRAPWDAARSSANTADLRGKILRIDPNDDAEPGDPPGPGSTYTVPPDNLFTAHNQAWHHLFPGGMYDPQLARPEIYTMGHRNPFTIAIDPQTDDLWIGQVGPDSNPPGGFDPDRGPRGYDTWGQVREAGNYGWPFCVVREQPYRQWNFATQTPGEFYDCEGGPVNDSPRNTGLTRLPPAQPWTIWYPYCNSQGNYGASFPFPEIPCGPLAGGQGWGTGRAAYVGDVYDYDPDLQADGKFPEYFDGKPFLMEWERDIVATVSMNENGTYVPGSFEEFGFRWRFDNALRFRKPHDLEFGPDGNLYLIEWGDEFNFAGGGVNPDSGLYRISYVKGGRTPRARATATPDNGQPPLEASFSSAGTVDPDGEEITYQWNFGDGATSDEPNPTHVYTAAGVYSAQLTVTDTTGRSSSSSVTITVGNTRPVVEFVYPSNGLVFKWGDEIPYKVEVVDREDGSTENGRIGCEHVVVQRGLWHRSGGAAHVHPGPSQTGCEGTMPTQADADHGDGADIATVLTASYSDRGGHADAQPLTGGVTHLLQPHRKQAEFPDESSGIVTLTPSGDGDGDAIAGGTGAWARFEPINLDGVRRVTLRAAARAQTKVELRSGSPQGPLMARAAIPQTVEYERVPGRGGFGNALRLNGPTPYHYVDLPRGIVSDLDEFTIGAWVNRATTSGQQWARVFDFGTGGNTNMSLTIHGGTGAPRYAIRNLPQTAIQQVNAPASAQVPVNEWTHVAVTYQGTTATVHINGQAVASGSDITLKPSDLGVTDRNWIGRSQFADPFLNATVDDFQIFDRALSPAELQSLVAAPGGGALGGGNVAWYRFDEDRGEAVLDSSGHGRHGTVVLSDTAPIPFTDVTVGLAGARRGTLALYLVFPAGEARVNWLQFQRPPDF